MSPGLFKRRKIWSHCSRNNVSSYEIPFEIIKMIFRITKFRSFSKTWKFTTDVISTFISVILNIFSPFLRSCERERECICKRRGQRTLTFFVRGRITVWLTSWLTVLDLAKQANLLFKHKQSSWIQIQTSQTGGQPYSDTSHFEVSECFLNRDWELVYQR